MKLRELVGIMNIADVGVASNTIKALCPSFHKKINMFSLDSDPILEMYGDYEVCKLTNIAKTGDVVWIEEAKVILVDMELPAGCDVCPCCQPNVHFTRYTCGITEEDVMDDDTGEILQERHLCCPMSEKHISK